MSTAPPHTGSSLWLGWTNADVSPSLPWRWQPCWSAPISAFLTVNLPEIDLIRELGQRCKSLHEGTVYPPCHPWTRKRRKEVQFQIERRPSRNAWWAEENTRGWLSGGFWMFQRADQGAICQTTQLVLPKGSGTGGILRSLPGLFW